MQLLETWQRKLIAVGMSPHTRKAYTQSVNDFMAFLVLIGKDILTAVEIDTYRYVQYMSGDDICGNIRGGHRLAPATIKLRLTALNQFYKFLLRRVLTNENPFEVLAKDYKNLQNLPWIPNHTEWHRFLKEAAKESLRNRLMVGLAYDGALRRGTLVNLERRDIDVNRGTIHVRKDNSKGHRGEALGYISEPIKKLFERYLPKAMAQEHEGTFQTMPLFCSESNRNFGAPITDSAWNKIVTEVARRAKLRLFSTHTFRHIRLTHMAEAGFDVLDIMKYAGHKRVESTMRYIHRSGRDIVVKVAINEQLRREQVALLAQTLGGARE